MPKGVKGFLKGHSGYKKKGTTHQETSLKNMLEEILRENVDVFKDKILSMASDPEKLRDFKWLIDLIAQYELKAMPTKTDHGFDESLAEILQAARDRAKNATKKTNEENHSQTPSV